MINWLDSHLIDDWRTEWRRLWSIRIAAGWGALSGLILVWPALAGAIPLQAYVAGGIVISAAFTVERFVKQPGADN